MDNVGPESVDEVTSFVVVSGEAVVVEASVDVVD